MRSDAQRARPTKASRTGWRMFMEKKSGDAVKGGDPSTLATVLERELGDAALVEPPMPECDHALVLLFRRGGQRQVEPRLYAEHPRDGRVLRGMGAGEIAIVGSVLHVF